MELLLILLGIVVGSLLMIKISFFLFLLVNNALNWFYMLNKGTGFRIFLLRFFLRQFLNPCLVLDCVTKLVRPEHLGFSISFDQFRLFFLFRVKLLNQFTEKFVILMEGGSLRVFLRVVDFGVVRVFIVSLPFDGVIVIIG